MVKLTNKIAVCLLLGLGFLPLSAYSNNSLTQLDIKKSISSDSTLNVTIYTSSPYDDNVAVSKKTDNKYVILMPNVSGVSQSRPDLSGLHDVISDIDIKSIQDGENGYTKVTLTTTKPVTIKTATKRSAPLTAEQKAYKNLIAQSRVNKPVSNTNTSSPKTTIKFSNPEPVKATPTPPAAVEKQETKPLIALESLDFTANTTKEINLKPVKNKDTVKSEAPAKVDVNSDLGKHAPMGIPVANNELLKPTEQRIHSGVDIAPKVKTPDTVKASEDISDKYINKIKNSISDKTNKRIAPNMLTTFAVLLCSILGLTFLFKLIKKSIEHSNFLKQSFKENLLSKPVEVKNYDDIVNDSDLSWQEKYQKYVNDTESSANVKRIIKPIDGGEYRFANEIEQKPVNNNDISDTKIGFGEALEQTIGDIQSAQLQPKKGNKFKAYNKISKNVSPENIPPIKKVKNQDLKPQKTPKLKAVENIVEFDYKELEESLERTLHKAPNMEDMEIVINEESVLKQMKNNMDSAPIFNEADKIAETMHKSRKLKSFANKMALEEARRNAPLPKMRSEIRKSGSIESKHVELGSSSLHTNPRKFEGANLSVGDLIVNPAAHTTKQLNTSFNSKKYSTVTIDEFFDEVDNSSAVTAPASLASKVADSLGKMSTEKNIKKIQEKVQEKVQQKINPFDGLVVKSGYNIDDKSGFYVVRNNAGNTSLIGRMNNDMITLKDFGSEADVKLQVRADNANVYMVKANGYRYLVEINNNKMGVLLEL